MDSRPPSPTDWRQFRHYFLGGALVGLVFSLLFAPRYLKGAPWWAFALAVAGTALLGGGAAVSQADSFWETFFGERAGAEKRYRLWIVVAMAVMALVAAIGVFVVGRYGFPKV